MCDTFDRVDLWYQNWHSAAENIAAGYGTPEAVVEGWMKSDGHRKQHPQCGLHGSRGRLLQGFGRLWRPIGCRISASRRDIYPMVINGDSPTTDDRDVDVYINGSWSEMRLRNDSGRWGDWQPFASGFTWTINDGVGEHTISAEVRTQLQEPYDLRHNPVDRRNHCVTAAAADHQLYCRLSSMTSQRRPWLPVNSARAYPKLLVNPRRWSGAIRSAQAFLTSAGDVFAKNPGCTYSAKIACRTSVSVIHLRHVHRPLSQMAQPEL